VTDLRLADAEFLSYRSLWQPARQGPYLIDISLRELRAKITLAGTVIVSTLPDHIPYVVSLCSKKQVIRVYTCAIIASVENTNPVISVTIGD
jgi:hypothetical protein